MARAIVHIGTMKTGTSSIQAFLRENARKLPEYGYVFDEEMGFERAQSRRKFAEFLTENLPRFQKCLADGQSLSEGTLPQYERWFRSRVAAHNRDDRLIISSEGISVHVKTPETIAAFDAWMRSIFEEVSYVCYVRNQVDLMPSLYSEFLKSGMRQTLTGFVQNDAVRDYDQFDQMWRNAVGDDRFTLRLFDRERLINGDSVQDFCDFLNLPYEQFEAVSSRNPSLCFVGAEVLRSFNVAMQDSCRNQRNLRRVRMKMVKRLRELESGNYSLRLTHPQADEVFARHADCNEKLRTRLYPEHDSLFSTAKSIDEPKARELFEEAASMLSSVIYKDVKSDNGTQNDHMKRKSASGTKAISQRIIRSLLGRS